MARIPYLNDWTISYALRNASGTLIQPAAIACAVTNANGSAVTLAAVPTWDAATSTTLLAFTSTEVGASAYATRWTATWTGTASGTDFTDVESLIIVAPGQEEWHTTVCEVKEHLNVTGSADDADIAFFIEQAQDTLEMLYELPTVPRMTEARYVTVHDSKLVLLDECVSITSIADESGTVLTGYTLLYGRTASHHLRGFLLDYTYAGQLTITGVWGYDSTPADVNRALLSTVGVWYKRSRLGDANDVVGGFSTLPREAKDLMEARTRVSI